MTVRWRIGLLVGWIAVLVVVVASMLHLRERVLSDPDPEGTRAAWNRWREEAERQSQGEGPVARRPPQVRVPPAVLLMADYFWRTTFTAALVSSALYVTLALFARGALSSPARPDRET